MKRLLPAIILLVLMVAAVYFAQWRLNKPNIPELYPVPDFSFQTQFDKPFQSADLAAKISVVDFIFTNCPGICPAMSRKMAALYDDYSNYDDLQFVSFSVDPARDSLEALQAYADRWGVTDDRWLFIRTDEIAINQLYTDGFKLGGELPYGHSGSLILIDQNKTIRGYYSYDDDESISRLREHIEFLIDEV